MNLLRRLTPEDISRRDPVDEQALREAAPIVADVKARGEEALREHAIRFGDLKPGEPLVIGPDCLEAALRSIDLETRQLLERTAARIRRFADAQRSALAPVALDVPGGRAGHDLDPVLVAGCYAPGGRFPLPSSVLMTAITARAAGVETVWVASPHPGSVVLAAARVAGADAVLACGGAQAIAALAYGAGPVPACDVVVGPGNRYVTAAKQLVAGRVRIDFLAGPSELVVLADSCASPAIVAADLLAQAEHDPEALPILVSCDASVIEGVEHELARQLIDLPTASIARAALAHGGAIVAKDIDEAVRICNLLAPEHLELAIRDADVLAPRIRHCGALFVGAGAAEVLADYGIGPNHVLPTGGSARSTAGLSVLTFLRLRTWLRGGTGASDMTRDAAAFARLEGLEAHARAAERREEVAAVQRAGSATGLAPGTSGS